MSWAEDSLRDTLNAVREVADELERASRGDTAELRGAVLRAIERLRSLRALPASAGDHPIPPRGGPRIT